MVKDFLLLVARPAGLLVSLRRITVGGLLAAAGLSGTQAAARPSAPASEPPAVQPATIVDRSRKRPALLLRLPSHAVSFSAQHRSHRSHSSHRSSSSGGGVAAPVAPRRTEPAPAPRTANPLVGQPSTPTAPSPAPSAVEQPSTNSSVTFSGVIEAIDRQRRTITIREPGTGATRVFAYRDDSKLQTVTGSSIRFDEFEEMSAGQFPVATSDKVQVAWRTSADGRTSVVSTLMKIPGPR